MFDNIGVKMQKLAKLVFGLSFGCSILLGTELILLAIIYFETLWFLLLIAPIVVLLGLAISWLSVMQLYAFGQVVEDVHAMRNEEYPCIEVGTNGTKDKQQLTSSDRAKNNANNSSKNNKIDKDNYESNNEQFKYIDKACPECGETVSFKENEMELVCPWCNANISRK